MVTFMKMDLDNTKVVLVAAQEDFRDEELFVPEDVFSEAGAFVLTASGTKRTIHGMLGGSTDPDIVINDIDVDSLDALVLAGGSGSARYLWNDEALMRKVSEAYQKNKIIGAICLSCVVLARAGIMKDRRSTVYPMDESLEELRRGAAVYVNEGVVVSDKIVTAQGPEDAKEFAETILALLQARLAAVPA